MTDGIADFVGDLPVLHPGSDRYRGVTQEHPLLASGLPARIKNAAGGRWPAALGDTIEFGCGLGLMTQAVLMNEIVRSFLVLDTDIDMLRACQDGTAALGTGENRALAFAALAGGQNAVRDAVADTVIGCSLLSGIGDTRAFLSMVHRVLKPGGRAMFVVPNRRFHYAICLAISEALTQQFARQGSWPDGCETVMILLADLRRVLVHHDDKTLLNSAKDRHLFNSDALQATGEQIGFTTAEVIPLDPDPAGAETIIGLCRAAGSTDTFARQFGPLAATVGAPLLNLLTYRDCSALSLLWLTKATGPTVRIYTGQPARPPIVYPSPDVAVGGAPPRWSLELLGRDTPDGVVVKIAGWCLSNLDVLEVRVTLDGSALGAAVWRHRPDVHEVLNRLHIYHSLNALCSGVDDDLLFLDVHPKDTGCALRVDVVLAGGLTATGPAPETLVMNQPMVIAH